MSEEEFNKIFAKNLRSYMDKYELTQVELSKRLSVSLVTMHNWLNAIKTPRMDKIDALCEIFRCNRSDLMQDNKNGYYVKNETAELAQELHDNPELHLVFDAVKDASPEELQKIAQMIQLWRQ